MKSRNEEEKLTDGQTEARKPRFTIEKLEERIAPHSVKIYGPHRHHGSCDNRHPRPDCR